MEPIPSNDSYFYELSLLDSFSEFHPDWFSELTVSERDTLVSYYAWGLDVESVIEWRDQKTAIDPDLGNRARTTLAGILNPYGVSLDKLS